MKNMSQSSFSRRLRFQETGLEGLGSAAAAGIADLTPAMPKWDKAQKEGRATALAHPQNTYTCRGNNFTRATCANA